MTLYLFYNRASVSKFDFRCFRPLNGRSSAHRAVPELRIELPESLQHARGPEIGQKALNDIVFFYKFAGVSKFYFRCFRPLNGPSSAHRVVPELRIELPASLERARGPEIGPET